MKTLRIPALVGATIAMATAFIAGPVSVDGPSVLSTKAAFAADDGKGDGRDGPASGGTGGDGVQGSGARLDASARPDESEGDLLVASPHDLAWPQAATPDAGIGASAGALSAAHVAPTGSDNGATTSRVGMIAAYERAMRAALDMPADSPAEVSARNAAIRAARRDALASAASEPLTPGVVGQVDALLGLPLTDPTLGL